MSKMIPVVAIKELLFLNPGYEFFCTDELEMSETPVYGIGNAYVPDHALTCGIPWQARKTYPHSQVKVQVHILWLETNDPFGYSGLVIDKTDHNLYWIKRVSRGIHHYRYCAFEEASFGQIEKKAVEHNLYLNNVINLAVNHREQLLDYQVYSNLSDRFYYMEIPFEDRVVMCGAGLHSNALLEVGWVGKLANKDFFVSYAECTPQAYEQLKAQTPSLYSRGQQMEKNRPLFSYMKVVFEKRNKYPQLVKLLLDFKQEPLSTRTVSFFGASAYGTNMQQYYGQAFRWMEEFVIQCRKTL